jgi:sensor c-di-GMP phosphodiesterase-like protein
MSEHDQGSRATTLARIVLDRAARTTEQLAAAFSQMQQFGTPDPCTEESISHMRQIDLGSSLLQGIGFAVGNELKCSSIDGRIAADMGPPDLISATGQAIRQRKELAFARDTPLLVVTGPSGYTGFVHPALIFEMTDGGDEMPTGIVGYSTRALLLSSRTSSIDWSAVAMPEGQMVGTTVLGGQLVAWVRSSKWDQFSFAAIPWTEVRDEF